MLYFLCILRGQRRKLYRLRHRLTRQRRMPQQWCGLFYRRNTSSGYAVGPAHNKRDNYDGIEVTSKTYKHRGIFGQPCFRRDVAVADGKNGHIAEVEQIIDGLITRAKTAKRIWLNEFNAMW